MNKTLIILILLFAKFTFSQQYNINWYSNTKSKFATSANCLEIDKFGNNYTSGSFFDTVLIQNNTIIATKSYSDIFIAKYDYTGNLLWINTITNNYGIYAASMSVDNLHDYIFITGGFAGKIEIEDTIIYSRGNYDIFTISYDADGNFRWIRTAGSSADDRMGYIKTDKFDGVYISGYSYKDYENYENFYVSNNLFLDFHYSDFLIKYDIDGNVVWATKVGGSITSILTDENFVYIGGRIGDKIPQDTTIIVNELSGFLMKFDLQGNYINCNIIKGGIVQSIAIDDNNNIFLLIYFCYKYLYINEIQYNAITNSTIMLLKMSQNLNLDWNFYISSNEYIMTNNNLIIDKDKLIISVDRGKESDIYINNDTIFHDNTKSLIIEINTKNNNYSTIKLKSDNHLQTSGIKMYKSNNLKYISIAGTYFTNLYLNDIILNNPDLGYFLVNYVAEDSIENENKYEILLYPNPSDGYFKLNLQNMASNKFNFEIYDLIGKRIYQNKNITNQIYDFDFSFLTKGVYIIKIYNQKFNYSQKLIFY